MVHAYGSTSLDEGWQIEFGNEAHKELSVEVKWTGFDLGHGLETQWEVRGS